MYSTKSKYKIEEQQDGFVIRAEDRPTIVVRRRQTGFEVTTEEKTSCQETLIGLYEYRRLCHQICENLMGNFEARENTPFGFEVRPWALEKTRTALGHRIHEQWKRLVTTSDADVRAVQKAVFATSFRAPALLHDLSLYRQKFFVQDIIKYRAAAHLVEIASQYATTPLQDVPRGMDGVAALKTWQDAYSNDGKRYRSLSRTLMNLPGGIPSGVVATLRRVRLERPMTDRLELLTFLIAIQDGVLLQTTRRQPLRSQARCRMFQHAPRHEISAAMQMVAQALTLKLSPRRTNDITIFVRYVLDCPDPSTGSLTSFTRRSLRWHADSANFCIDDHDDGESVVIPPVDLPGTEGVRFLSTVGEIRSEGVKMQHCVAAYVSKALKGGCYLFHVDHKGDKATVEVTVDGQVRQSCGPCNSTNAATEFGRRALGRWGATLQFQESVHAMFSWLSAP